MNESAGSLDLGSFRSRIADAGGRLTSFYEGLRGKLEDFPDPAVWIARVPWSQVQARLAALEAEWSRGPDGFLRLPLYGVPFAVKDNIDVEGLETTAACPAFAYRPEATATVVTCLLKAGAVLIGKTNMDQFATGLVGTRSPYGTVRNPFHPAHVPGGSSSGSAVAVAAGLVSFALGTDTAGSGRVPAGFNNVVGLKPSRGALSAYGVFPACRSLDCVSVFALTSEDAFGIFSLARGIDAKDPFTREIPADREQAALAFGRPPARFQFGVPDASHLAVADAETRALFGAAIARLEALGGTRVEIPFASFAEAARLLYQGSWLAERQAAFGAFVDSRPGDVLPVITRILSPAKGLTAEAGFRAYYKLRELKVRAHGLLRGLDALLVPTAPFHPTREEVEADPIGVNARLGAYTNFVNLLDLCALAIPSGMRANGLPFGVTLIAPAFQDGALASLGAAFHAATGLGLGTTAHRVPSASSSPAIDPIGPDGRRSARLAVAGLHLSGQPLNWQLLELGARLNATVRTAPNYRMHVIERPGRKFPGVVRVENGERLELEVWEMSPAALGAFMEKVLEPLCIGTVELENGEKVKGFLCETWAVEGARDITALGGWRTYLAQA
ncbi:MAG: allophanate hydrolase [Fibrobacteres bacterium]|jgi:allophanate hydrolase|nr:allophanate hydrolase [Fibrobacterota bacterium]